MVLRDKRVAESVADTEHWGLGTERMQASGGRFAFGRLIDRQGTMVGLLPPGIGQRQIVIDNPPWLAVAEMLVRKL